MALTIQHVLVPLDVGVSVVQDAVRARAVAARAARLLVVALHGLGQAVVDHEAHVRLVDAHAERDRCADLVWKC